MGRRSRDESRADEGLGLPVVALLGRPNVGKSSLFNRFVGGRPALVEDVPGVTRDRRYGVCDWQRTSFRVVDTGGLDPSAAGILGAMRAQTLRAVDEAAVLILLVDAAAGVTALDEDVARLLRRTGKPVLVAANKVDSAGREGAATDAFRLGFDQVFAVSAAHGRGTSDLLDAIVETLADQPAAAASAPAAVDDAARPIRIAFVGKPNVGKSSLVNRLLGEDRVLVHDQPGTTRDPIDTPFRLQGRDFVLVDTAGLRRRRVIDTQTEAVAAMMARDQLARADVAVLVIDVQQGATAEDARLVGLIEESGRGAIVVLNKCDLVPRGKIDERVAATREELAFAGHLPVLLTSAVTGRGVTDMATAAAKVFGEWSRRVPTSDLNRHFEEMVLRRPPPAGPAGRHVRLYYITQPSSCPPTFFVSTNQPKAVADPYRRYLANQLRRIYGFAGAPIRVVLRGHQRKRLAGGGAGAGKPAGRRSRAQKS